ncbi:ABC transporter permease/M1 family aminopeptidase [Nonlabens tegetincola]|uniref:ABC transporter permease/M1 family aminopeptidase n=1 Tax=Nonlabens tegetincola TaxID=323273 RepID=UPI000CF45050|nr:M1 family aminopeptidase [Nonlabens tegetincola]PQJ19436.1 hypothetical protein BST93_06695 [Nonlabens tegetincola]
MFSTIFLHELRTWFKKPLFYIYTGVIFLLSLLITALSVGVFDSDSVTVTSPFYLNSAVGVYSLISGGILITYLLIPSIIGGTIQRDFSSNMHHVLYSYPLNKVSYLLAKFSAGMLLTLLIILASMLAVTIGFYLPGANEDLIGPFSLMNYIQPFLVMVIPNVFFYGAIVFAITTYFRNINLGFMSVLILIICQFAAASSLDSVDDTFWIELLEPTGESAIGQRIKYWTPDEQGSKLLPTDGTVLYNRLLWLGFSVILFLSVIVGFRFSQHAISVGRKKKSSRVIKRNFGTVQDITLPKVSQNFSFFNQLKTAWTISKSDIKYIVTGWPFIIIAVIAFAFSLLTMLVSGQVYGTDILPKTWLMLQIPAGIFSTFTYLLIYLYTGFIMDRSKTAHMLQLVDTTPTKNWVFQLSRVFSMSIMVFSLFVIVMLSGIIIQTVNGFNDYQIDLYLFDLFMIKFWEFLPWILMSILIHTLIKNKWLGLMTLLVIALGLPFAMEAIGVEQAQFIFNQGTGAPSPSDMNGYGDSIWRYFTFRGYWIALGIALFGVSLLFFRRGMSIGASERIAFAKARLKTPITTLLSVGLIIFVGIGSYIWKVNNIDNERTTGKERELLAVNKEKELSKYLNVPQPRITDVKAFVDIYPETRDFKARAEMLMVNKSSAVIDTLHVNINDTLTTIETDRKIEVVYDNEDYGYRMYRITPPLQPGDTLEFNVATYNKENTFFEKNSPVVENGTFMNNFVFPSIGYNDQGEIRNTQIRKKYELPPKDRWPDATKPGVRDNNYIGGNSDWINFEATLSTSPDQIAISPGYLTKEWEENNRKYYYYKMDSKMVNFYNFMSGRYEVMRDEHDGIKLEIYYHKDHDYNIDRMMAGLKAGLDYYNDNFTPYQHRQVRIIEFPRNFGTFAQAFANTIPFSEGIGFIADVDGSDKDAVDYPFSVTAHELAHQWWAHQVIGAYAKGATLLSESLSEYSSLKVLEKSRGKEQMRSFLKDAMDKYLLGRTVESIGENPLMYNENQQYIHYQKGSLVLYAMSDYLGEKQFNNVIKQFAEKYQFQGPPYPTAIEFVDDIRAATPDSLQYLIKDMFETITLYDNDVKKATYTKLDDGRYQVEFTGYITKYRSDKKGKSVYKNTVGDSLSYTPEGKKKALKSLPLADYIDVGVFGEKDDETGINKVLYLKKHKIVAIENKFSIIVDEKPVEVGIDPFNILIDRNSNDNRTAVKEKE